jgi:hypothetical protein
VLLGGEGSNELGSLAAELAGSAQEPHPGVLETLARKVVPEGWESAGGVVWKNIRKFQSPRGANRLEPEARHVAVLVLQARERGADAVIFCRDSDGDENRARAIEAGLEHAQQLFPDFVRVAGGVAHRQLESWVLALCGQARSEDLGKTGIDEALKKKGLRLDEKDTAKLVALVARADVSRLPSDATSLRSWCDRVRRALAQEAVQLPPRRPGRSPEDA